MLKFLFISRKCEIFYVFSDVCDCLLTRGANNAEPRWLAKRLTSLLCPSLLASSQGVKFSLFLIVGLAPWL